MRSPGGRNRRPAEKIRSRFPPLGRAGAAGIAGSAAGRGYPAGRSLCALHCGARPAPSRADFPPTASRHPAAGLGSASGSQRDCCPVPECTPACPASQHPPRAVPCPLASPRCHHNHSHSVASEPPGHKSNPLFLRPHRTRITAACCYSRKAPRSAWKRCILCRSSLPAPARRGVPGGKARSGPATAPDRPGWALPENAPAGTAPPSGSGHRPFPQRGPAYRFHPPGKTPCAEPPAAAAAWRHPAWAVLRPGHGIRGRAAGHPAERLPARCNPARAPAPSVPPANYTQFASFSSSFQ